MASRLILRIQERSARLTSSEKKIAQVLLRKQSLVETHTATELAALAGVSKATTARFFRSLGYSDFEEVRLQAREERNRREPYAALESVSEVTSLGRTIADHLELAGTNDSFVVDHAAAADTARVELTVKVPDREAVVVKLQLGMSWDLR